MLSFAGGGRIEAEIAADGAVVTFRVTRIVESPDFRVGTLEIPGLHMTKDPLVWTFPPRSTPTGAVAKAGTGGRRIAGRMPGHLTDSGNGDHLDDPSEDALSTRLGSPPSSLRMKAVTKSSAATPSTVNTTASPRPASGGLPAASRSGWPPPLSRTVYPSWRAIR
ncbi:hypothetical protein ACFVDQ_18035 [Streptomyces sp. NPDC057684]|uniref:hypothetical protein n=1 Tax=Streptomyces sp. NPDC057684 TaxID=3346211 RepID=UPI00368BC478